MDENWTSEIAHLTYLGFKLGPIRPSKLANYLEIHGELKIYLSINQSIIRVIKVYDLLLPLP